MSKKEDIITGIVVDETFTYSLKEVCETCGVHAEYLIEMVEYGILEPVGKEPGDWRFPVSELMRFRKALRLQRDLDINLSGLPLVLNLIEENVKLRNQLDQLRQQLKGIKPKA